MNRTIAFFIAAAAATATAGAQDYDSAMREAGMVDAATVSPGIVVELMYASPHNFVGQDMYGSLRKAYLHPEAAAGLEKAGKKLEEEHPGYRLKICDAARPMSVQKRMFDKVKGTSKSNYVSNPARGGGLHNYGPAVDITIVDSEGKELPMGTPVDHLGPESNIDNEQALVDRGAITTEERRNRQLLRRVMRAGGFMTLRSEWWHFNFRSRAVAKARYKRLDF